MLATLRKLSFKLALLAGVPVIGAALLAAFIAQDAQKRARSAEALGSIEDLAELSARMTDTVGQLQTERARVALGLVSQQERAEVVAQQDHTDRAVKAMEAFLMQRDLASLPRRLGRDLASARSQIRKLAPQREHFTDKSASIDAVLEYYGSINTELIDATAALIELSNDAELLRALSSLVATMQVKERSSREHAVLSHTFANHEFAPGLYRYFVTLITEESVYASSLQSLATDAQSGLYREVIERPVAKRSAEMRKKALETNDDEFGIDANDWFQTQQAKVLALGGVEKELAQLVRNIAHTKVVDGKRALAYSQALTIIVLLISVVLAWIIGRRISRSVNALASVAGRVQLEQDFSLRAPKLSDDELGNLTDAFNEMLSGIQHRDEELRAHRENLESLVAERTAELSKRNEDMRLVLDTVEQGLVTIDRAGVMSTERSQAFDTFFGIPKPGTSFAPHIAGENTPLALGLELDWSQISDGFLPLDLSLGQARSRLQVGSKSYALAYKPLLQGEEVSGALLMISDITSEMAVRREEALQREQATTFARAMKDKSAFVQFFNEARKLVERLQSDEFASASEKMRAVHTLKGNAALFGVSSVADSAHVLEQALVDAQSSERILCTEVLLDAWDDFAKRIIPVMGENLGEQYNVTRAELDELMSTVRTRRPHAEIEELLVRLEGEPVRLQLERIADRIKALSHTLGKPEPEIVVSADDLRLSGARFSGFWASLAHVVRNIADHALQSAETRVAASKSPANRVELSARRADERVIIEIRDDGNGIDWQKVADKARDLGLPYRTRAELTKAVFASGVSTSQRVSDTSGRGVGMSAVAEACRALDGEYALESEPGQGTLLRFELALHATTRSRLSGSA